jgi:UPF0324 membrane protein CT0845
VGLYLPGIMLSLVIAVAASFVSEHYGGPKFLYALLIGVAFHFLSENDRCRPGIEFSAKRLVRVGVALLGVRIVVSDVSALGLWGILGLAGAVVFTLCFGVLMARVLRVSPMFGLLSGGGTGICGISATMAISSTLPQSPESERCTLMSAIGIASLSTAVMVLYPLWVRWFGMTVPEAGLFLGGSIHDVAQVVGAGSILSPDIAKAATLAKMFRVAMLVPVVLTLSLVFRRTVAAEAGMAHPPGALPLQQPQIPEPVTTGSARAARATGSTGSTGSSAAPATASAAAPQGASGTSAASARRPPLLPFFLVMFVLLVTVNSLGLIPPAVQHVASDLSGWALVVSISALGIKTSFEKIAALGWRPIALMVAEALFVAAWMMMVVVLMR